MILILAITLILTINFSSFASVATPSNYDPGDAVDYYNGVLEELSDEELEIFDNEFIDNTQASDRDIAEYIKDIFITAVSEVMPINDDDEATDISQASDPEVKVHLMNVPLLNSPAAAADSHKNVVIYHGTFNNYQCDLIIPYSAYASLDVVNDYLVNVGGSSITGKILYDDNALDPSDYDSYTYVMNPIYGSTNNVYTYGSFNYRRHYYLNTSSSYNRISYEDMYGNFYVDDIDVYYSASERQLYTLYVFILIMGVCFLWIRRH